MKLRSDPLHAAVVVAFVGGTLLVASTARADANYTVNVTSELNGLDVKIEPVSNPGVLVVNLTNNTSQKVRCDVNFQADPQVPNRSFVFIDPGKRESAVLRATQRWYEVDVDVRCKPGDK